MFRIIWVGGVLQLAECKSRKRHSSEPFAEYGGLAHEEAADGFLDSWSTETAPLGTVRPSIKSNGTRPQKQEPSRPSAVQRAKSEISRAESNAAPKRDCAIDVVLKKLVPPVTPEFHIPRLVSTDPCVSPTFTCDVGSTADWSAEKLLWCCENAGKGCITSALFTEKQEQLLWKAKSKEEQTKKKGQEVTSKQNSLKAKRAQLITATGVTVNKTARMHGNKGKIEQEIKKAKSDILKETRAETSEEIQTKKFSEQFKKMDAKDEKVVKLEASIKRKDDVVRGRDTDVRNKVSTFQRLESTTKASIKATAQKKHDIDGNQKKFDEHTHKTGKEMRKKVEAVLVVQKQVVDTTEELGKKRVAEKRKEDSVVESTKLAAKKKLQLRARLAKNKKGYEQTISNLKKKLAVVKKSQGKIVTKLSTISKADLSFDSSLTKLTLTQVKLEKELKNYEPVQKKVLDHAIMPGTILVVQQPTHVFYPHDSWNILGQLKNGQEVQAAGIPFFDKKRGKTMVLVKPKGGIVLNDALTVTKKTLLTAAASMTAPQKATYLRGIFRGTPLRAAVSAVVWGETSALTAKGHLHALDHIVAAGDPIASPGNSKKIMIPIIAPAGFINIDNVAMDYATLGKLRAMQDKHDHPSASSE